MFNRDAFECLHTCGHIVELLEAVISEANQVKTSSCFLMNMYLNMVWNKTQHYDFSSGSFKASRVTRLYLQESSIFMRGFVRMGVMGAEGTVWGDWGGEAAGEGIEGLSETLPSASFPFSLYRGAPAKEMTQHATKTHTWWFQQKSKEMQQKERKKKYELCK